MMIMNTPGDDIFRMIAAKWNNIDESQVTDQQRNQTKQLCYGIIYGMGRKALAESMNVDEEKAAELSRDFHATYPGIHRFTEDCVKKTEDRGYCHTLTGRRRYLPNINSTISSEKSQAERQALNTCIQGTASDLVKNAIINMEKNLKRNEFHDCKLVLHLHDELFYEVNDDKVQEAAKLLEKSMENAVKLTVPLKVKIKFGRNWGELKELKNLRK
jgi:DNA polymerase theta